jgi:hypothetical protein
MSTLDPTVELKAAARSALDEQEPADAALLSLLAFMACSDGEVHDHEVDFLAKVLPGRPRDDLSEWALEYAAATTLDLDYLVTSIKLVDDRWRCLRFAARMAWKDGEIADDERMLLASIANKFEMPKGAVDRVLREMAPSEDGGVYTPARIIGMLQSVKWEAVQLAGGGLVSDDLIAVRPTDAKVVARVGLDKVEVMALCTTGVVGRFQQGPAFVKWGDIVSYTRDFQLGSSLRLHMEDASSLDVVDSRMGALALVLDRLFDGSEREAVPAPTFEKLRGE